MTNKNLISKYKYIDSLNIEELKEYITSIYKERQDDFFPNDDIEGDILETLLIQYARNRLDALNKSR